MVTASPSAVRQFELSARTTDVFGRVLCSARNHHFVVDGPVQNGCPGEALTPPELFLASVAACGVELTQVLAREQAVPLTGASVRILATIDRAQQPRADVTLFNSVRLRFTLSGVDEQQADALVAAFRRR
jgi:uncharacterized OsmC-like protein